MAAHSTADGGGHSFASNILSSTDQAHHHAPELDLNLRLSLFSHFHTRCKLMPTRWSDAAQWGPPGAQEPLRAVVTQKHLAVRNGTPGRECAYCE